MVADVVAGVQHAEQSPHVSVTGKFDCLREVLLSYFHVLHSTHSVSEYYHIIIYLNVTNFLTAFAGKFEVRFKNYDFIVMYIINGDQCKLVKLFVLKQKLLILKP